MGLLFFDTQLHFFGLGKEIDADDELPPMFVVPDAEDPFPPTPQCTVKLSEKRHIIERVLRAAPQLFAR